MNTEFVCEAPNFVDFEKINFEMEDTELIERYFDSNHEDTAIIAYDGTPDSTKRDDIFHTPAAVLDAVEIDTTNRKSCFMRKSLSMSCLPEDVPEVDKLSDASSITSSTLNKESKKRPTSAMDKPIVPKIRTKSLYGSKDTLCSQTNKNSTKYVSMAEAINKFQFSTPERFRSKPKVSKQQLPVTTVPQSPAFATRGRVRQTTAISTEELKLREFEDHQKLKFKARPVNAKLFEGPVKPVTVEKKPCTVVHPFSLTEVQKRVIKSPAKLDTEFHANPVAKGVHEYQKPVLKENMITEPKTPNVLKRYNQRVKQPQVKEDQKPKPFKPTRTQPVPFSFEERNVEFCKKRDQLMQRVLEEERKQREFHAKPVPKNLFMSPGRKMRSKPGSLESIPSAKSDDSNVSSFKARPALVLQTKPFVPKKSERPPTVMAHYELHSDRRAREREEYDIKLKERQEELEAARIERKALELENEQREIARLRKEALYLAQPIRHFKNAPKVPPKPVTDPSTPKFSRRFQNKENIE